MKIKLSFITIDAGTQSRQKINQDVVNDYAQLLSDGAIFPPIVVLVRRTSWPTAGIASSPTGLLGSKRSRLTPEKVM
jgi:hypothetical protein